MAVDRNNLPEGLLEDIKAHLDITWSNHATDTKIRGMIADGMIYLNKKLGGDADYTADGTPRTLLKEYCRYARDYALDVFENNYLSQILSMQNERAVERYVAKAVQTEQGDLADIQ